MRLYLVRHGEALPESVDPEQPLSERGRREVSRLAEFLAARGASIARVLHSGKTRARQTAELIGERLRPARAPQRLAGLGATDPVTAMVQVVAGWTEDTLVVGHEPFLGRLASALVVENERLSTVAFVPAGLVCLERRETAGFVIAWAVPPEVLA